VSQFAASRAFNNDAVVLQAAVDDTFNHHLVSGAGLLSASSADSSVASKFRLSAVENIALLGRVALSGVTRLFLPVH